MDFSGIKIGKWYMFFSKWHNRVVMGQTKERGRAAKGLRVTFHKVVNLDGSSAGWNATSETNVFDLHDVIGEVKNNRPVSIDPALLSRRAAIRRRLGPLDESWPMIREDREKR